MDRNERKKKLKQWRLQQRKIAGTAFPLPDEELDVLFDELDAELSSRGCDDTPSFCRSWLTARGHSEDMVIDWFNEHGGYCDCEVLINVGQYFEENRSYT